MMAEVISCYWQRQIAPVNDYPNRFMHHPDEKVQVNGFLADWLDYCLRFGHLPWRMPSGRRVRGSTRQRLTLPVVKLSKTAKILCLRARM